MLILNAIIISTLAGLYRALIFLKFYGWFIVTWPDVHAPRISYGTAYGIAITLGVLFMDGPKLHREDAPKPTMSAVWTGAITSFLVWSIVFASGYVAHLVMG